MSRRPRRNHSTANKAKVAIDGSSDGKTVANIAHEHDVHQSDHGVPPPTHGVHSDLFSASVSPQRRQCMARLLQIQ